MLFSVVFGVPEKTDTVKFFRSKTRIYHLTEVMVKSIEININGYIRPTVGFVRIKLVIITGIVVKTTYSFSTSGTWNPFAVVLFTRSFYNKFCPTYTASKFFFWWMFAQFSFFKNFCNIRHKHPLISNIPKGKRICSQNLLKTQFVSKLPSSRFHRILNCFRNALLCLSRSARKVSAYKAFLHFCDRYARKISRPPRYDRFAYPTRRSTSSLVRCRVWVSSPQGEITLHDAYCEHF